MSRAFIKEQDGESPEEGLPELPASSAPNYVTPEGLASLQKKLAAALSSVDALRAGDGKPGAKAALARAKADARRLQRRVDTAVLVETDDSQTGEIRLGARVVIEHPDGTRQTFTVVGEDEADPLNGFVSWASPLGEALLGKREGDVTTWHRPAGDLELKIVAATPRS